MFFQVWVIKELRRMKITVTAVRFDMNVKVAAGRSLNLSFCCFSVNKYTKLLFWYGHLLIRGT